jgi:hypothetical protein
MKTAKFFTPPGVATAMFFTVTLLFPAVALGDWFRGSSRAIALGDSASPDAPVTSYAYGPRSSASLGLDSAIFRNANRDFRLGISALMMLENHDSRSILPSESLRSAWAFGAAWTYGVPLSSNARNLAQHRRTFELGVGIGQQAVRRIGNYTFKDRYRVDDVPFGAGGYFLSLDAGTSLPWFGRFIVTTKLGIKLYTNVFPEMVSASEASDHVADAAREGSRLKTHGEIGVRIHATNCIEPVMQLYLEAIDPHDDQAKPRILARVLSGIDLLSDTHVMLYLDAQAGHGAGLAVNRTELRFGLGVRLYAL